MTFKEMRDRLNKLWDSGAAIKEADERGKQNENIK